MVALYILTQTNRQRLSFIVRFQRSLRLDSKLPTCKLAGLSKLVLAHAQLANFSDVTNFPGARGLSRVNSETNFLARLCQLVS